MKLKLKIMGAVLCAIMLVGAAYAAAGSGAAGSSSDPLVTLSYLTQRFTPQMEAKMDELVKAKADELTRQFNAAVSGATPSAPSGGGSSLFAVVTLNAGQTLVGDVGCEVMLRVGSAVCGADSATGLIDVTDGSVLANGGELVRNHLYMVTISTRSVRASGETVKVLVRGPYTIV